MAWCPCLPCVPSRPGGAHPGAAKRVECLDQSLATPVEHVIVRQYPAIDPSRGEAGGIVGMHPVVDALWAIPVAGGDGGLEIDDTRGHRLLGQDKQRVTPDVVRSNPAGDRTIHFLRELKVGDG